MVHFQTTLINGSFLEESTLAHLKEKENSIPIYIWTYYIYWSHFEDLILRSTTNFHQSTNKILLKEKFNHRWKN